MNESTTPHDVLKLAQEYVALNRTLISGEETLSLAREVVRLHKWADGMADRVLEERRLAEATIKEFRERLEKAFGEITRLSALSEKEAKVDPLQVLKTLVDALANEMNDGGQWVGRGPGGKLRDARRAALEILK